MNIFSFNDVTLNGPDVPLFEHASFGIDDGEKIGMVGPNGCGKSSFLMLLKGLKLPESGDFSRNSRVTVSILPQQPVFTPEMTVGEFFLEGDGPLIELNREYEELLHGIHTGAGEEKLALLTGRMENEGGFSAAQSYLSYCRELGIDSPEMQLDTMSGGMVRKVSIARTLASGASFICLDEPTNHLDLETIEWLEDILKKRKEGFLVVTHDRRFLDSVCTSIIEIDRQRLYKYEGSYSLYLEKRAERRAMAEKAEQRRITVLRRELEWLRQGPKARTGRDRGRKERLEKMLDDRPEGESSMREFTSSSQRLGKKILEIGELGKSYSGNEVISSFTYSFGRAEKIGIIGPNGSGKTTFFELVSGNLQPDRGTVEPGINTRFAYLRQGIDGTASELTVIEYIKKHGERIAVAGGETVSVESFLEDFLFPRAMFTQPLGTLSGGELRRLNVIAALATSPNFILLDEPTNDLDIDTIRLLEDYLTAFSGCVLLISHDRAMLERLCDHLFVFDGRGGIEYFTGDYDQYRTALENRRSQASAGNGKKTERKNTAAGPDATAPPSLQKKKLSFNEKREYETILDEISGLEQEKQELEESFSAEASDPEKLKERTSRYELINAMIEEKTARWEELALRAGEGE